MPILLMPNSVTYVQVAFPAFRQLQRPGSASLVDYFQVTLA